MVFLTGVIEQKLGFSGEKSGFLGSFHSNPCWYSLVKLCWFSSWLFWMQNLILHRVMVFLTGVIEQKLGFSGEKSGFLGSFHSNPCWYSFVKLCWFSSWLCWMQNLILHRVMVFLKGVIEQKLGFSGEKPRFLGSFHSNLYWYSLVKLCWLSSWLCWMQNLILHRVMVFLTGVIEQKLGFSGEKSGFLGSFHSNPCWYSLVKLCWLSSWLCWMQNLILHRVMVFLTGVIEQKLGF